MGSLFLDVSGGQHMIRHNNVLSSTKSRPFVEKQSRVQGYSEVSCGSGDSRGPGHEVGRMACGILAVKHDLRARVADRVCGVLTKSSVCNRQIRGMKHFLLLSFMHLYISFMSYDYRASATLQEYLCSWFKKMYVSGHLFL